MNIEIAKENMIKQQAQSLGLGYGRILNAILDTPREAFIPKKMFKLAYSEVEISLDHNRKALPIHTIIQALKVLDIKKKDRILEIGCRNGYFTALLANLGNKIETCDLHLDFVNHTQGKLHEVRRYNVTCHQVDALTKNGIDLFKGKYDIIVFTPKLRLLPYGYVKKLAVGGRLLYFFKKQNYAKAILVTMLGENNYKSNSVFDVYHSNEFIQKSKSNDLFKF